MHQLKKHIEKRFGEGIEYKGNMYYTMDILSSEGISWLFISNHKTNIYDYNLSINDLCSSECTFLESLDFINSSDFIIKNPHLNRDIDNDVYIAYDNDDKHEGEDYHRMQLSILSNEDKILYILQQAK